MLAKLRQVSGQETSLEWWARCVHPWDSDLSPVRQSELFSQQALLDTEAALIRLFRRLPDIHHIAFRVLDPLARHRFPPVDTKEGDDEAVESPEFGVRVILAGNVERQDVIPARHSQSIKMRLMMMGVRFLLVGGHLEPLAA
jgi:hypothetical protein